MEPRRSALRSRTVQTARTRQPARDLAVVRVAPPGPTGPLGPPALPGEAVREARAVAGQLLAGDPARLSHTRGVAATASVVARVLPPAERPVLVAAAWLHDVGYAPELVRHGYHPLDGARWLADRGWDARVVGLVAHHSGARFVAAHLRLARELADFGVPGSATGPLADALAYADQRTGRLGEPVDLDARFAEVHRRQGPGSATVRVSGVREPALRAAVRRTEERLARAPWPVPGA